MFSQDQERIIPRKRINLSTAIQQAIALLFFLAFIGVLYFGENLPEFLKLTSDYLIIIFVLGILGVNIVLNVGSRWIQGQKWQALADELGLKTEQRNRFTLPTIQGTHRGHRVQVSESTQRRGRSRAFFTNYVITLNTPSEHRLAVEKRSLAHLNRYKTGDDEFDKKLSTQTTSEKLLDNILRTRRLRLGLIQLGERARTKKLSLSKDLLTYTESGQTADTEYMSAVIGLLAELAHTVERIDQIEYTR